MDFGEIFILLFVFFQGSLGVLLIGRFLVQAWHSVGRKTGRGGKRSNMTSHIGALTDLELAQASAVGEVSAFEELYRRHQRKVYSLCLRMLGNVPDAEDVTQEVFIQLYRKIGTFKGTAALSTWLHRLTVNTVLMHLRAHRQQQREQPVEDEEMERAAAAFRPRADGSIIDQIDLERAIRRLSPGYRAVFLLHDVEGYEHEEIADILGIAVGTTKSQLHKARLRLRKLLLGYKRPLISRLPEQAPLCP